MARVAIWLVVALVSAIGLPAPASRAEDAKDSRDAAVSPKEGAVGVEAAAEPAPAAGTTEQSVSMFPIKGDKPLSIRSDELEAIEVEGKRHLLFTRNVNIEQGDLRVHSDRLEAFYPQGGNQPDKLVATGHVRVSQLDKTMICETATYFQSEDRLLCVGNAEVRQGTDKVTGKEIEIYTKQNRMKVKGGAIVNVAADNAKQPAAAPGAPAAPAQAAKP
jgi:lipopolysaccharide export system protein LptA